MKRCRKINQILLGCALGLATTTYKGRCGSWVFDSHTFCVSVCFFYFCFTHIKLHLSERGQAAELTGETEHMVRTMDVSVVLKQYG